MDADKRHPVQLEQDCDSNHCRQGYTGGDQAATELCTRHLAAAGSILDDYLRWRTIGAAEAEYGTTRRSGQALSDDEARKDGVAEVKLSYHPGDHSPQAFYTRFGFLDTGEVEGGEVVMRLPLD